jgi:hypothetical protein
MLNLTVFFEIIKFDLKAIFMYDFLLFHYPQKRLVVTSKIFCANKEQCSKGKGKAVPLYTMEALGGKGGIAPTNTRPRH